MKKLIYLLALLSLGISSCRVFNPSTMLRTDKDYEYAQFADSTTSEYTIKPNDIVRFQLFANDGFKIIDLTSQDEQFASTSSQQELLEFSVEYDGMVKLPIVGRIKLAEMTLREAETMLEQRYEEFYVKPFVMLRVVNRRVVVFTGNQSSGFTVTGPSGSSASGSGRVVPLTNEATTLIEVLAQAGGISGNGKAWKVKLVRGDLRNPQVFLIDLSTMEGIQKANLFVEAGDIIYVEPSLAVTGQILDNVTRILGIISTTVLTIVLVRNL